MKLEWKTCIRLGLTVILIYLAIHYWQTLTELIGYAIGAAFPLLLGACIAFVANILMCFYERFMFPHAKKKLLIMIRRPLCILLAFISILLVIFFVMRTIVPELIACIGMLLEQLPHSLARFFTWLGERLPLNDYFSGSNLFPSTSADWQNSVSQAANLLRTGVSGVMGAAISVVTMLFSTVVTLVLAIIFAIYLLCSKENLIRQVHRLVRTYCGEKIEQRCFYVLRTVNDSFHHFIVGQCTEALILGSLCILGMVIFRFPYAGMIGTLVGFTALIPIAGAYIAAAIGAFMIVTLDPVQALWFLVFLIILQQLENNLIFPRVVGSSIGLPALWVLAAVTIGGGLFGVVGMLVGVPLVSAIYKLLSRDMTAREQGISVFDMPDNLPQK